MNLQEWCEVYDLIFAGTQHVPARRRTMAFRKRAYQALVVQKGFTKVAFDTRRIDQTTEFNPRRGLQNYHRSQAFVDEAMAQKVRNFSKLQDVLGDLKVVYGEAPGWQDSNARVLLSTLNHGLRTFSKDGDFTDTQPALGSFDYIEELLHVRYRLTFDDLTKIGKADLKEVILSKDEELTHQDGGRQELGVTKFDVSHQSYDTLLEKLFNVRASADRPDVERTVTITIRDTIKK